MLSWLVFGYDHAHHVHAEVDFVNVKVPENNMLLGECRGFEPRSAEPRRRSDAREGEVLSGLPAPIEKGPKDSRGLERGPAQDLAEPALQDARRLESLGAGVCGPRSDLVAERRPKPSEKGFEGLGLPGQSGHAIEAGHGLRLGEKPLPPGVKAIRIRYGAQIGFDPPEAAEILLPRLFLLGFRGSGLPFDLGHEAFQRRSPFPGLLPEGCSLRPRAWSQAGVRREQRPRRAPAQEEEGKPKKSRAARHSHAK